MPNLKHRGNIILDGGLNITGGTITIDGLESQSFKDGVYSVTSGLRTDSITVSASDPIEIKSMIPPTGEVVATTLEFTPPEFETDEIVGATYTGIQPTGGSGTGLVVTVVVTSEGSPTISSVTVTSGGTGYQPDDVVSIATSELGADPSTESTTVSLIPRDLSPRYRQRILMTPTGISIPDLPIQDPGVAGQLWNDRGTLKISNLLPPDPIP